MRSTSNARRRLDADALRMTSPAAVCERFEVRFKLSGNELRTRQCPTCGQRSTECVAINASTGLWHDHAHSCRGDVFSLIAGYAGLHPERDFAAVLEIAAQICGVSDTQYNPENNRQIEARRRADQERRRAVEAERAAALASMPARWESLSRRSQTGEAYIDGRGPSAAELRLRGDVVRYSASGEPAVALRDLVTGAIVGIQYRCLSGGQKLRAEKGSQLAGSALFGKLSDIDSDGVDIAVLCEGLIDTLTVVVEFPGCAVFGAPGAGQMARIAAAVAPKIAAVRGWLLVVADDDAAGIGGASDAVVEAVKAGLRLEDDDAGLDGASSVRVVDLGAHHDLTDAYAAGWRYQWPERVAS